MTNWLETIELRTSGKNIAMLEKVLQNLVKELETEYELAQFKIYCSLAVEGDYCIHLFMDLEKLDLKDSTLGIKLVSILKEFGLVHHCTWVKKFST
jgi:hypothetical protein